MECVPAAGRISVAACALGALGAAVVELRVTCSNPSGACKVSARKMLAARVKYEKGGDAGRGCSPAARERAPEYQEYSSQSARSLEQLANELMPPWGGRRGKS